MEFFDVSDWLVTLISSTKGTRDKLVLVKPGTEDTYFLKFPMVREGRDYTPENWSEVIAYEVGTMLGFNVLQYNLAAYHGKVGCISKNMTTPSNNESLTEGHSILSRYDSTYDPADKSTYNRYTFDFVQKSLNAYGADFFIEDFIRTLIFDAIIGNRDRHQSNWGIIESQVLYEDNTQDESFPLKFPFSFPSSRKKKNIFKEIKKAAPIYDSGCCLGREFGEDQIFQHLEIQSKFEKYIRNGVAELRTGENNERPTHEELLTFIKRADGGRWKTLIETEISKVLKTYNIDKLTKLINEIDTNLPDEYRERYGLSMARKTFIIRVIDTRVNNLRNI